MRKKVSVLLAMVVAAALTACGGEQQAAQTGAPAAAAGDASGDTAAAGTASSEASDGSTSSEGKVTLQYWHAWSGANAERLEKAVEIFNASQDEIEVVATNQGADYWEVYAKALTAISAGESPDLLMIGTDNVGPYTQDGLLENLAPYMTKEELDDLVPAFADTYWGDNGELWVLSWGRSCPVLYVNQDMFDKAGLEVPTTWDEVDEVSQKLIASGVTSYGYSMPYDSWYFIMIVPQMGGTLFNEDLTALGCIEDGTLAKGLQMYQDQVKNKTLYFGPTQNSSDTCRSLFLNGECAMYLHSCSQLATIHENAAFNYTVNALPAGVKNAVNTGGCTFGMTSASEHKEAAWKFMQWYMTAEDGAATIAAQTGYIPWTKSMSETQVIKDAWEKMPQAKNPYQSIVDYGEDSGRTEKTGELTSDFMATLEAVLYDQDDVNTVVEELDREVKSALE